MEFLAWLLLFGVGYLSAPVFASWRFAKTPQKWLVNFAWSASWLGLVSALCGYSMWRACKAILNWRSEGHGW